MSLKQIVLCAGLVLAAQVQAQSTSGTLVLVPAYGEVVQANDEAVATFSIEEQDKDKAAAASRVNQKMKLGSEILRREDPQAALKTHGYYTFAVYADDRFSSGNTPPKQRQLIGWRVGQSLEFKTSNLATLPKTTAAAQKVLALDGLQFELMPATRRRLDEQRIAATYRNLTERIASIAAVMGKKASDASIDTIDFEGAGNALPLQQSVMVSGMRAAVGRREPADVAEPSFEPGETTLDMRLVGKVRFK